MRKLLLAAGFALALAPSAKAQGVLADTRAMVVSSCGAQAFPLTVAGEQAYAPLTILPNGTLCTAVGTSSTSADQTGTNAIDGQATSTSNQHALAFEYIFNGSTWDRARGTNGVRAVSDAQNAPYGLSGAVVGATLTPGATTAATPGRNIHIFCAPITSPATGYTTLTEANGETHQIQLATGAQYDFPWAVTLVAAQTTVTGTLAACEFKNMN